MAPEATEATATEPIGAVPVSVHHSKVTVIAVPSSSVTVALSCGVSVLTSGRPVPVTQLVVGTVARAVTVGQAL
nr:hypothetical protein GCM10020092_036790 [Actinoplanes digitatis]